MVPNIPTDGCAAESPSGAAPVATESPAVRLLRLWNAGSAPDLGSFLAGAGDLAPVGLAAVLRVDQRERWRLGQRIPAETYLQRFPSLRDDNEGATDLVYGEFLLREKEGAAPHMEELRWRFPHLATVLQSQIELHRALQSGPSQEDGAAVGEPTLQAETLVLEQSPQVKFPGPVIPGYEIECELGRGGMGVVYKVRQLSIPRLVALKMIRAEREADGDELARFRTEAAAVGRLQHPNIVHIHGVGEHEGRPYLVLEFVEGGSLADRLGGTPLSSGRAAELTETLALAVHYAHQRGIVHRDLKPANVLLGEGDTPKITDFGLAKFLVEGAAHQTETGAIVGTPSYMAPEQIDGKSKAVGPAADVYALGAILYELLTGRPPFKAETVLETLQQVRFTEPVPPRHLQPHCPRDLNTICLKCIAKEPHLRYVTAQALADDLRRYREGLPIRARAVGPWERGMKWARRRPVAAALVVVSCVAAMSLTFGGFVLAEYRRQELVQQKGRDAVQDQAQALILQGEAGVSAGSWGDAEVNLASAVELISSQSHLNDLRGQAESLLAQAREGLDQEKKRRSALSDWERFFHLRDEALFHQTLLNGPETEVNLEKTRAAAEGALRLYGLAAPTRGRAVGPLALPPMLSEVQCDEVREGCYELFLVLAEAVAHPSPDQPSEELRHRTHEALLVLDAPVTMGLGRPTRAYHLRRARYLEQAGEQAAARAEREQAASLPPSSALDHFLLGDEWYKQGRLGEAAREFDQAVRLRRRHFWAHYFLAICQLKLHRPGEAKTNLNACLDVRSDFAWAYLLRGFAHSELGEFDAAEADFRVALAGGPSDEARYGVLVNRGVVLIQQGNPDGAVAALLDATRLKADRYQAYVNLAQAYQQKGCLPEALAQMDRAINLEPKLAVLHRLRARILLENNDVEAALRSIENAIQADGPEGPSSERARHHLERGQILHRAGRHEEAARAYKVALEVRGDYPEALRFLAAALLELGRDREAAETFDLYLRQGSPTAEIYRERGLAKTRLKDFRGAIDDYTLALGLQPGDSATYASRGWANLAAGGPQLALSDFQEAVRIKPDNADAYNGLGHVQVALGKYQDAIVEAEKAVRHASQTPAVLLKAARVYAQAFGQLEADPAGQSHPAWPRRSTYRARALDLLEAVPHSMRAKEGVTFWMRFVRPDPAFTSLRGSPRWSRLEGLYFRAGQ